MTLVEKLREIRDSTGSDAALARAAGVSRSNVFQWFKNGVESLDATTALQIQEATGYSARWLVLGLGPKKLLGNPVVEAIRTVNKSQMDVENLIATIDTFRETDDKGRDAILAGVRVAQKRIRSHADKASGIVKRG